MIDFSASACTFEIRVNDVPVAGLSVEGQAATAIPVNYAILQSGKQEISAKVLPLLGNVALDQKAELKFDFKLFDIDNDFVFKKQFGEYRFPSVDKAQKLPVLTYNSFFQAEVPYRLNAWQNGENLKDMKHLREKLREAYEDIKNLIDKGQYKLFKERIKIREHNMAVSMYLSQGESESRVEELIADFQSGFKVMPVPEEAVLQQYAYGKVAALKKSNGESALYLKNPKTKEELMIDIAFYIPKGKSEFEVI